MVVDVVPSPKVKHQDGRPITTWSLIQRHARLPSQTFLSFHLLRHNHAPLSTFQPSLTDHEIDHQAHDVEVAQPKPLLRRIRYDLVRVVVAVIHVQPIAVHGLSAHHTRLRRLLAEVVREVLHRVGWLAWTGQRCSVRCEAALLACDLDAVGLKEVVDVRRVEGDGVCQKMSCPLVWAIAMLQGKTDSTQRRQGKVQVGGLKRQSCSRQGSWRLFSPHAVTCR